MADTELDWGLFDFSFADPPRAAPDEAAAAAADNLQQRYYAARPLDEDRQLALNAVLHAGEQDVSGRAVRRVLFATVMYRDGDWFYLRSAAARRRFWNAFRGDARRGEGAQLTPEALSVALADNERDYDQMTRLMAYLEARSFAYVVVRTPVVVDLNAVAGALATGDGPAGTAAAAANSGPAWWEALFRKPVEHTLVEYTLVVDFALTRTRRSKTQRLLALRTVYCEKPAAAAAAAWDASERTRTTASGSSPADAAATRSAAPASAGLVRVEPKRPPIVTARLPPTAASGGTESDDDNDASSDSDSDDEANASGSASRAVLSESTGRVTDEARDTRATRSAEEPAPKASYIRHWLARSQSSSGSGRRQ